MFRGFGGFGLREMRFLMRDRKPSWRIIDAAKEDIIKSLGEARGRDVKSLMESSSDTELFTLALGSLVEDGKIELSGRGVTMRARLKP